MSRFCGGNSRYRHQGAELQDPIIFQSTCCLQRSGFQEECDVCSKAAAAESTAESGVLSRLSDKTLASSIHRHNNHRGAKNRGIYSMQ